MLLAYHYCSQTNALGQAVQLLNQLLFGPVATAPTAAAEAAPADAGGPLFITTRPVTCGANTSSSVHARRWQRYDDLDGPDLAAVQVPTDGISGMGIKVKYVAQGVPHKQGSPPLLQRLCLQFQEPWTSSHSTLFI